MADTKKLADGSGSSADMNITFEHLAVALANDYQSVYYLNTEDDSYVEYGASGGNKTLKVLSEGADFFADTVENCRILVYKDDQKLFLDSFRKDKLLAAVRADKSFTLRYRLVIDGRPQYYYLKTIRGTGRYDKFIIIGVRNIDEQVRREMKAAEESRTYEQIAMALASRYEVIYYIDITDNSYIEYSSSEEYAKLGVSKKGDDFFASAGKDIQNYIHPDDRETLLNVLEKEKLMKDLDTTGNILISYRQLLGDRSQYVSMLAVRPRGDRDHVIIGVLNIDAMKRRETEYIAAIGNAMDIANHDALTSVKNKHAYQRAAEELDYMIKERTYPEFSIAVFDINGLKDVNDSQGHSAGDEYIKSACRMICLTFKHSPVYRIGGDEFVAVLKGDDYRNRAELFGSLMEKVWENSGKGLVTVACGMADFDKENDTSAEAVFKRADNAMYENKKQFKTR